jgi:hypothetical protein
MLADVPENSAFQASHACRSTVRHGPQPGALAHIGADDVSYFAGEQRGQHTTSGQGAMGGHFLGSVAKFDFWGKIQKSGIRNSTTYRLPNSRKSNFATEPFVARKH